MFSQFFGNYLLENQKITDGQYSSCMDYIKANRVKLGLIAEAEGLLTREQATKLNQLQTQSDKRFGDLAIEQGYLTESDVDYLLSRQGNPYLIFVQALEENQCLSREEIEQCLKDFQSDNGYSDTVMKAIQDGDIEQFLPAFVEEDYSDYLPLIGLALRSIVRFISSYIRIEKGRFVPFLKTRYAAYQHTVGDHNGFLGFCSDSDGILAIASGYTKEELNKVDEDALDAVGEFTNCINGLYAAELSYQDINIDMQPPELLFDTTIKEEQGFYVLPLYLEGRQSSLIIKIGEKER